MRLFTVLAAALVALPVLAAEPTPYGAFKVTLDPANNHLPTSIVWTKGDVELIDARMGLDLSFTDFEFRTKIYRDENRNAWPGKNEARFATDAVFQEAKPAQDGDFLGVSVAFSNSFASAERRLLFHKDEPRFRIEYRFKAARDVTVHEADMMAVAVLCAPGFSQETVCDARAEGDATLTATGLKQARYSLSLLNAGPSLLTNPEKKVSLFMRGVVTGLGSPVPAQLVTIKKDAEFALTILGDVMTDEAAGMKQAATASRAMDASSKPYQLVTTARILMHQKKADEAEAALLKAAELNKEYAAPYGILAGLRRDTKAPGDSQTEAWVEAAYRMPYNYGYILSGLGFTGDKRLTEEQRRLAIFNALICVENTQFYANYYIWAARPFENMKMHVQACAMWRQALWAADRMPFSDAEREKFREQCKKKIADLEAKLLSEPAPQLPALIPVRLK